MLELKDISVQLDGDAGKVRILQNINLSLENKKIYVLTGPNGGGKSSLAKTIMGIYQPESGQILLDGEDITHKEIFERARLGIGYAFQQPARFKGIKVQEFLNLAAGDNRSADACDLLFDVGLCAQDYLNREINASFSGGELKRIEIASVLARDLKVAIFDEPEAGIDLWSFQKLVETFQNINNKYDTTIMIISHQERIIRLADQVIIVDGGKIGGITSQDKILGEIEKFDSDCRCRRNCSIGGRAIADCHR